MVRPQEAVPASGAVSGGSNPSPAVALVRVYDGNRVFLAERAAPDGVLVVPLLLSTRTVEAVTAGGVTLGRVDLLGHAADFGD